jgi:hypothetical protein
MIATKNTTAAKRTPYCDTCYRKGLSEKEYTSHYTKSEPGPRGVVVCPTILNADCRACGMKGHWASEKFCPLMRREAKEDRRYNDRREQEQKMAAAKPVVKKTTTNVYAALMDDEGEAVSVAVAPPVASLRSVAAPTGPSWADMAAKPAVLTPKVEEPSPLTTLKFHTVYYDSKDTKYEPIMTDAEREAYRIMNERKAAGCFAKRTSWLDLDDDDDDDEEW